MRLGKYETHKTRVVLFSQLKFLRETVGRLITDYQFREMFPPLYPIFN